MSTVPSFSSAMIDKFAHWMCVLLHRWGHSYKNLEHAPPVPALAALLLIQLSGWSVDRKLLPPM